jgi:hypothetical protein
MIRNETLLQGLNLSIKSTLNYLDFSIGSKFDLQVLVSANLETRLPALMIQGSKLSEVNEERLKSGLHAIAANQNERIVSEDWKSLIESNDGVVVVVLNNWRRMKLNSEIEQAIETTLSRFTSVLVDKLEGTKGDYFFVYNKDAANKKKTSKKAAKSPKKAKEEGVEANKNEES